VPLGPGCLATGSIHHAARTRRSLPAAQQMSRRSNEPPPHVTFEAAPLPVLAMPAQGEHPHPAEPQHRARHCHPHQPQLLQAPQLVSSSPRKPKAEGSLLDALRTAVSAFSTASCQDLSHHRRGHAAVRERPWVLRRAGCAQHLPSSGA